MKIVKKRIKQRKWNWIEHTRRKDTESIERKVLDWNPLGKIGRERPRQTWRRLTREIKKDGET